MPETAPEQVDQTQDQQTVAPDATPAATPLGDGPWANDFNQIFQDDAARRAADQYMRTVVQPYQTNLEKQLADTKQASTLWNDLSTNPVETYVAITNELYGEEAAEAVLSALQDKLAAADQQPAQPQTQEAQPVTFDPTQDPRLAAALEYIESQQAESSYQADMQRVLADNPDVQEDDLHYFVAAAEGDFDKAVQMFHAYEQRRATRDIPSAPPVIGSGDGGAASSTTPVEQRQQTLDEAINDFMAENRANRNAPPVSG